MRAATLNLAQPTMRTRGALEFLGALLFLGVVVSLLAPRMTQASLGSQDATLADCLRYLRTQIQVYALEHGNIAPGFPAGDVTQPPDYPTFIAQLTQFTDESGRTSEQRSQAHVLGPYMAGMPSNPLTLRADVLIVTGDVTPAPDESQPYGWIYNPRTRQIVPNVAGVDSSGMAYSSY